MNYEDDEIEGGSLNLLHIVIYSNDRNRGSHGYSNFRVSDSYQMLCKLVLKGRAGSINPL